MASSPHELVTSVVLMSTLMPRMAFEHMCGVSKLYRGVCVWNLNAALSKWTDLI